MINQLIKEVKELGIEPDLINRYLEKKKSAVITQKRKLYDILLRPEIRFCDMLKENEFLKRELTILPNNEILDSIEVQIKYDGYICKERLVAEKISRLEHITIRPDFDYSKLESLSTEARQKLTKQKPASIKEAQSIPGVSPSDINVLLVYFGR
jgi:tRNA uridine 5-carboxymethylaminomethyl modification enzyme